MRTGVLGIERLGMNCDPALLEIVIILDICCAQSM